MLLASSKSEPLVWTNAVKVKALSLGGLETRQNFYLCFQFSALFCHV